MHLIETFEQISQANHVNSVLGYLRHIVWQFRKPFIKRLGVRLRISDSMIEDNDSRGVLALVNCLGMYDYNNMSLIRLMLEDGGVFLDVGANIGSYALIASEIPAARIVAIEPNPAAFAKLKSNIGLNSRENITLINAAVSNREGEIRMTSDGSSPINHVVIEPSTANTITVRCRTLDNLCDELGVTPTVVKMDIEGHEPAALAGFAHHIGTARLILIEDGDRPECRRILKASGFDGPYHVDYAARSLMHKPVRRKEDSVYVRGKIAGFTTEHSDVR